MSSAGDAGVIEGRVQATGFLFDALEELRHSFLHRYVECVDVGLASGLRDHVGGLGETLFGLARAIDDRSATGEEKGGLAADARTCARDQRDFSLEIVRHGPTSILTRCDYIASRSMQV
jgi:hypothetical protein